MRARLVLTIAAWLVAAALLGALGFVISRIAALESRELDARGEVHDLATVARADAVLLVEADLVAGEEAVFELCSSDAMSESWGDGGRIELRVGEDVAVTTTLDASARARALTNANGACLEVGRGTLEAAGLYRIVMRYEGTPPEARVRGRIVAKRPLGPEERNGVLAILGLALLLVVVLAMRAPSSAPTRPRAPRWVRVFRVRASRAARRWPQASPLALVSLGASLVVLAGVATPFVLPGGSTWGLVAGVSLALVEVLLAWALLGGASERLALSRPRAAWMTLVFFASAPIVGFVLRGFALWALSHVEATGEAPIEAFVAWPSGLLSFGALAVVAPIAEEVFFRGFVYGAIDDGRWGSRRALAFTLAWGLFALAHLQQAWGNWGGLLAVSMAGLVFTTLRMLSGSTLVPALAHLVYNALLSVSVLTAAGALVAR